MAEITNKNLWNLAAKLVLQQLSTKFAVENEKIAANLIAKTYIFLLKSEKYTLKLLENHKKNQ